MSLTFTPTQNITKQLHTLDIGAPGDFERNDRPGYVKVYLRAGYWKQLSQIIRGERAGDQFGNSVALSADGKTLAVGAHYNAGNGWAAGHVRVFILDENGSSWNQLGQDIDGEAAGDLSGISVSISSDGRTVALVLVGMITMPMARVM